MPKTSSFLRVKKVIELSNQKGGATFKYHEFSLTKYSLTKIKSGDPINYEGWIRSDFLNEIKTIHVKILVDISLVHLEVKSCPPVMTAFGYN